MQDLPHGLIRGEEVFKAREATSRSDGNGLAFLNNKGCKSCKQIAIVQSIGTPSYCCGQDWLCRLLVINLYWNNLKDLSLANFKGLSKGMIVGEPVILGTLTNP